VPDQDRRRGERAAQMIGGCDQIVDVRRKRRVGELAFAGAQAGEIEPQRRNAALLQPIGDVAGRPVVLIANKAVREQRDRANFAVRAVEKSGQRLALGIAEIKTFGGHEHLLRGDRVVISFAATVAVDRRIATSTNGDGSLYKASTCRHDGASRMRARGRRTSGA
jgi:hypothetical protein